MHLLYLSGTSFALLQEFGKLVIALDMQLPEWSPPGGCADLEEEGDGPKVDSEMAMKVKGELYGCYSPMA